MLFRTLGVLEISSSGQTLKLSAEKPRRLLSMLLLRAGSWVSDAELVDVLWPDGAPVSAPGNIKSYISQLRTLLGPFDGRGNRIERIRGAYRLNVSRDELDTMIFEDLIDRGEDALAAHNAEKATTLLSEALDLWRGDPFELLDVAAARTEHTRLAELRSSARHSLADALVADGKDAAAIALLRSMTVEDPLRENTWHSLMTVLYRDGRRAEALAVYQEARRTLVGELGIEPGADLRELHAEVLGGRLDKPAGVPAPEPEQKPARRRRLRRGLAVVALVLAAAVLVVLAVVRRSPPAPDAAPSALVPTAAERYGWGTPSRQSDFAGDTTGPDWTANGPWPSQGNGHYVQANVTVRNGAAVITGSANGDTGHMWDSADATSGRLEVQLRIPPGCECHRPAMSLWSVKHQQKAGEIVFLEVPDGDRQTARFAVHHPGNSSTMETRRIDLTAWTTVAVEWTPDHVTGYLDGEQWFHTDKKQDIPTGALRPTIKMDWLGSAAPTESVMQIDWIRFYPV